ncbi:MAG: AAA family ATPase [Nanoarchaeota archaeon]|nr:AAA family ATPase [Nanoarchaeota archaeon]
MKIAITGTHSTGKTTLARAIAERFDMPYIRGDKAVDICKILFPGKDVNLLTVEEQWKFQHEMFRAFDEAIEHAGSCVTDGFHLTCIPYGETFTNGGIRAMNGYREFCQKVHEASRKMDLIIYLPPEICLEDDDFRPKSEGLRLDIDKSILQLLEEYNFNIVHGSVDERVRQFGSISGLEKTFMDNYIALEGLPRSGKSTQLKMLQEKSAKKGLELYVCRRNNSSFMKEFKKIRAEDSYANTRHLIEMNVKSLLYDFESNDVLERLDKGQVVVCDRQKFTVITMFCALGNELHELYATTYDLPMPGKVIYLDISPETSVSRSILTRQGSALKLDRDFQTEVKRLYEWLAPKHGFHKIDALRMREEITEDIFREIIQEEPHDWGRGTYRIEKENSTIRTW